MSGIFGSIETSSGSNSLRLEEVVELKKFADKQWVELRFLPIKPLQVRQYWVSIVKPKDGAKVDVPRISIDFDPNDPRTPKKGVKCPYGKLSEKFPESVRKSDFWLFNAIDKDMQEEGPPRRASKATPSERKTGFKDINSDTWTPVVVVRLTYTMIKRMKELAEDNIVRVNGKKIAFDASDAKHGFSVKVKFKKEAAGSDKYSIDRVEGSKAPLTEEEKAYLTWNLSEDLLDAIGRKSEAEALEDVKRMTIYGDVPDEEEEEDDGGLPRGKRRSLDEEEEEEEEDRPRKSTKSKSSKTSSKKPSRKSLDEEEEEEEEEDRPRKSTKSKSSKTSSKKPSRKSLDEDEEEEEEEDRPRKPAKPKTSKLASKKPSRKSLDEDEEDEEDRPRKPAKPKTSKLASKKPSRKSLDEDEEDYISPKATTPKRKTSSKPVAKAAPAKKKKKPAYEED